MFWNDFLFIIELINKGQISSSVHSMVFRFTKPVKNKRVPLISVRLSQSCMIPIIRIIEVIVWLTVMSLTDSGDEGMSFC